MSKHTPGPWGVFREYNVQDSSGRVVAACGGYTNNMRVEEVHAENIANAHLIAAAPDLLEALVRIIGTSACGECEELGRSPCVYCQARAAIAKAKGEQ